MAQDVKSKQFTVEDEDVSDPALQAELLQHFADLPLVFQHRVVEYAKELGGKQSVLPVGTPGRDLLKFAGTMTSEEADEMMKAIEEECERIDPNW
jgi:hypothetical protein